MPKLTLPALALPRFSLPTLRAPHFAMPALSMPGVAAPRIAAPRIPRTVWIVGVIVVLLLMVPLAYIVFPVKSGVAIRRAETTPKASRSAASHLLPAGSPQAVAAAGVEAKTGLKYSSKCAPSQACLSITGQNVGQAAAAIDFSTSQSGGRECVGYVAQNNGAWQLLNASCAAPGQVTPMVGRNATVHIPGNCARVHSAPSLSGGVAGCLYDGAGVKVDGGPVYADKLMWWHTNRGWIAHDFLLAG